MVSEVIKTGERYRVHYNIPKGGWSVTALTGENKGRVIARVEDITLADVTFHVSKAGRKRSQDLGKRTVHAWVYGTVEFLNTGPDLSSMDQVTYNPAKGRAETFVKADGTPVLKAPLVVFAMIPEVPNRGYAWT